MLRELINRLLALLGKRAEKQILKEALQIRDREQLQNLLSRLSQDKNKRVRDIAPEIRQRLPVRRVEDEIIRCPDCKVKEGEHHMIGCYLGLCPNATSQVCVSPMRMLRRDEVSPDWIVPGPPRDARNIFYVRLPSRCDECGTTHPMFPGQN
jgi:hypothetical protein